MTYDEIRKASCRWCAKGIPIDKIRRRRNEDGMNEFHRYVKDLPPEPPMHIAGYTDYSTFNVPNKWEPCTAPTPEAVIEQQAATIAAANEKIRYLARCAQIPARMAACEVDPAGNTTSYEPDPEAVRLFGEGSLWFAIGAGPYPSRYCLTIRDPAAEAVR